MNLYAVSFFGHRQIDNVFAIEQRLETLIRELLTTKEYVEFLVGRDGEFDQLVSSTVRRCKRAIRDDNSALVLVLPYTTAEYRNNEQSFHEYYGALYKKDDTAYLCWTYDPEVTYVLEYTPSKMPDSEVLKMAESAVPIEEE